MTSFSKLISTIQIGLLGGISLKKAVFQTSSFKIVLHHNIIKRQIIYNVLRETVMEASALLQHAIGN